MKHPIKITSSGELKNTSHEDKLAADITQQFEKHLQDMWGHHFFKQTPEEQQLQGIQELLKQFKGQ